jgi:hypothetical protein
MFARKQSGSELIPRVDNMEAMPSLSKSFASNAIESMIMRMPTYSLFRILIQAYAACTQIHDGTPALKAVTAEGLPESQITCRKW